MTDKKIEKLVSEIEDKINDLKQICEENDSQIFAVVMVEKKESKKALSIGSIYCSEEFAKKAVEIALS